MSERQLMIFGCSSQQVTRQRNHSGYLVRWNGCGFLFDPGEGTQRQFIQANVAPPVVRHIFISHFHGDHCLGLGAMLVRLNLDAVPHVVHCHYPASGQKFFRRLRYSTIYRERIRIEEHPIYPQSSSPEQIVWEEDPFTVSATFLDHGVDTIGWRIQEKSRRRFDGEELQRRGIVGKKVRTLQEEGSIEVDGRHTPLEEVSWMQRGASFTYLADTRPCPQAVHLARRSSLLLSESTYLEEHAKMAQDNYHMTARQAATIAKKAQAKQLVLTHFSARYTSTDPFVREARSIFPRTYAARDLKSFSF